MAPLVIKLGGSAAIDLDNFLGDLATLEQPYVLVHGAHAVLDDLSRKLGHEPRLVTSATGQVSRYTDAETMDLFLMAYCGEVNKRIVSALLGRGVRAVGLSGMDGGIIQARRKPRIRIVENGKTKLLDGDFAGTIERVHTSLVDTLLGAGYVPVITPPAAGREGEALNVDGDKLAMELAVALKAPKLLIFSDTAGLLARLDDPDSTIARVEPDDLEAGLNAAQGKMKKKIIAAADAVTRGVGEVILASANVPHPVRAALGGAGTRVGKGTHAVS